MTDEETTVERTETHEDEESDESSVPLPDGSAYDEAAASFLEMESDLERGREASDGPGERRGLVVDGERVDASVVPADYPVDIEGERALALTVDLGDGETTVYVAWPGDAGDDTHLSWLLAAMGIDLGDLYGRVVWVDECEGHDVLRTPSERPRNTGTWGLGVAGGHALNALLVGGLLFASGSLPAVPLFLLWLVLSVVVLPYATYADGWYLRTHSDWDGGPLFWATLSVLPVVNLLVGASYLRQRAGATFFGDEPSLRARLLGLGRTVASR